VFGWNVGSCKVFPLLAFVYIREESVSPSFLQSVNSSSMQMTREEPIFDRSRKKKKVIKPSSSELEQYAECGVSANTRTFVKCKEILSFQRVW
jgi:hypothetical protein